MQREELYLQDIIESISAIEVFLAGIEKNVFLGSDLLQSAVIHKLMIIGEASARLPDELKLRYPNTPWKKIVGLRNITAHAYFTIDWDAIWETVKNHLIWKLQLFCKTIFPILNCETTRNDQLQETFINLSDSVCFGGKFGISWRLFFSS